MLFSHSIRIMSSACFQWWVYDNISCFMKKPSVFTKEKLSVCRRTNEDTILIDMSLGKLIFIKKHQKWC